ncbi:unnamed protein product, partial [marine sediment metagenome]
TRFLKTEKYKHKAKKEKRSFNGKKIADSFNVVFSPSKEEFDEKQYDSYVGKGAAENGGFGVISSINNDKIIALVKKDMSQYNSYEFDINQPENMDVTEELADEGLPYLNGCIYVGDSNDGGHYFVRFNTPSEKKIKEYINSPK